MKVDFAIRLFGHTFRFCIAPVEPRVEAETTAYAPVAVPAATPAATPVTVAVSVAAPEPVERKPSPAELAAASKRKPGRKEGWRERQAAKKAAAEKLQRLNDARNANLILARASKAIKDAERKAKREAQ